MTLPFAWFTLIFENIYLTFIHLTSEGVFKIIKKSCQQNSPLLLSKVTPSTKGISFLMMEPGSKEAIKKLAKTNAR